MIIQSSIMQEDMMDEATQLVAEIPANLVAY